MNSKLQLYLIIFFLFTVGIGLTFYKFWALGFPLTPGKSDAIWIVEAKITFKAQNEPAKISLTIPDFSPGYFIEGEDIASGHFGFTKISNEGRSRAVWSARSPDGPQTLYYRVQFLDATGLNSSRGGEEPIVGTSPFFEEPFRTAADSLINSALRHSADPGTFAGELFRRLNDPYPTQDVRLLLRDRKTSALKTALILDLLARAKIPAQILRGLFLKDGRRNQSLFELIEVHNGKDWICFNHRTGIRGWPQNFIVWQRGGRSLLDLEGGDDSKVSFSIIRDVRVSLDLAKQRTRTTNAKLIDFSIYSLPIEEQNAFKILLLIPIGSLIVVIMRNLIGISTSGTFMPILIAIAFKQTELLNGLLLFCIIVGAGLYIRFHLSRLNLLLVPRISAVIIVVILLMAAMSIFSFKLGLTQGLRVTFFPMIILAWTIERLSILWEEQGHKEVLIQGSGSLIVASIAYLFMSNALVEHLTFSFPELILVILAIILLLGNYTGYRLLELWRFKPIASES